MVNQFEMQLARQKVTYCSCTHDEEHVDDLSGQQVAVAAAHEAAIEDADAVAVGPCSAVRQLRPSYAETLRVVPGKPSSIQPSAGRN